MSQAKKILCNGQLIALCMCWMTVATSEAVDRKLERLLSPLLDRLLEAMAPFDSGLDGLPFCVQLYGSGVQVSGLAQASLLGDVAMTEIADMEVAILPEVAETLKGLDV